MLGLAWDVKLSSLVPGTKGVECQFGEKRESGLGGICLVDEMRRWEDFAMTFVGSIWTSLEPLDCLRTPNILKQLRRMRPNLRTSIFTP